MYTAVISAVSLTLAGLTVTAEYAPPAESPLPKFSTDVPTAGISDPAELLQGVRAQRDKLNQVAPLAAALLPQVGQPLA